MAEGLVIFDLDGVLRFSRRADHLIISDVDWVVPHSIQVAVSDLIDTGIDIAIATNQGANIAKLISVLERDDDCEDRIKRVVWNSVGAVDTRLISYTYICPHLSIEGCECRKPKVGLIAEIFERFRSSLPKDKSFMVGDAWSDILTAKRFGSLTAIKVRDFEYIPLSDTKMPANVPSPDAWFPRVEEAIEYIRMKLNV